MGHVREICFLHIKQRYRSATHLVMTLSFWTDWSRQTVQTQIRLHHLLFHLHHFDTITLGFGLCLNLR